MRILLLTQWFDPELTLKGLAFARELAGHGHEVQVLTGFPNYPGGKLYPGYRVRLVQRETIDGISVIRVPLYPSHDRSSIKRIFNYASFAFAASVLGPLLVRPADVMYVYHPPATTALPALVLRFLRGIPFVYDIQDLWPDTLAVSGMLDNRMVLKGVDLWCRLTYKLASHIVVLSPGFKDKLLGRGVPGEKITVIYNWFDDARTVRMERGEAELAEPDMRGRFNVVFAGTMGKAQALDAVLDASRLVADRVPRVQFVFMGGGIDVERLKERAGREAMNNVLFLPWRPVTEIGSVFAMADALLVHLRDDPLFAITVPSKTQAYLAAGRPILMAVRGDAARLVEQANAGVVCDPEDAEAIAAAVIRLASMQPDQIEALGSNGARFFRKELTMQVGVSCFEKLFKKVVGCP